MSSPFPGPVPPYNNPQIEPQYFAPNIFFISDIITGQQTTTVTTTEDQNYVVGQLCRLIIPNGYGCRELNEATGYVLSVLSATQVVLGINSQFVSSFISASLPNKPQILAVGDVNTGDINSMGRSKTGTFIPGSFINISPN